MPDTSTVEVVGGKTGRTSGWYVLLLAWLLFAAAFFVFSKTSVKPAADITNGELIGYAAKFGPFVGAALGLLSFLASGLVYLIVRLFVKSRRLAAASLLTVLGFAPWLVLGYDLVYREPRYAEVARAIITYLGKPMLYASAAVCGLALVVFLPALFLRRRA